MPIRIAHKMKRLQRRFGIAAPHLVVRNRFSLHWLLLAVSLLFILFISFAWLLIRFQAGGSLDDELIGLREQVAVQGAELLRLRAAAGTEQNQVHMERSSKQLLLAKIQELERENGSLKEEIRLFERLVPMAGEEGGVRVQTAKILPDPEGKYRYRLLLAFQPGKQEREFRGRLEFYVGFQQDGKERQLRLPVQEAESRIEIKHFLRREGAFSLPAGGRLRSFEVRIFQGDTLKAQRLVKI